MGKIIANVWAALKWPAQYQKSRLKNRKQVFRRPFYYKTVYQPGGSKSSFANTA